MDQMNPNNYTNLQNADIQPSETPEDTMKLTGDPFVDAGGLAMETVSPLKVEEKIRYATDVYVDRWKGKLDAVFLHSKLNNNHVKNKPDLQRNGTLQYYFDILNSKEAISGAYCRICASKGALFNAARNNYPLVGSGEFTNFHHFHENGLLLCKNCLIKLYFLPLSVLQSGGNLMVLQFQNQFQKELWRDDVIVENMDKIARGTSEGILKSIYTNPQNALFHFSSKLIRRYELYDNPPQRVRLFCFTNFGSKPNVDIHDLPNQVFAFLKQVLKPAFRSDWNAFVKRHYYLPKSVHFDETQGEWVEVKRKVSKTLQPDEYQGTKTNRIHKNLLSGQSILGLIRKVHKQKKFPIFIAIAYLKEVREMPKEQIELITKVADNIINLCQKEEDYKKYITMIERAKYSYELRSAIFRMVKKHYLNEEKEPFIRFQDYVAYLFPDGHNWGEVRDFLLICLYEKLHALKIEPNLITDQEDIKTEETENQTLDTF